MHMPASKSCEKEFVYLGHRQYVQGASMSWGLIEMVKHWSLGTIEKIQMNFHSPLTEHGIYDLYPIDEKPHLSGKGYNTIFRLSCDTGTYVVGLKGNGNHVLTAQPCDEDRLVEGYQFFEAAKSAVLKLQPKSSLLNVLIALNKKLVNEFFPAEGYGQWVLSRYELAWNSAHISHSEVLEVKIAGNIGLGHTHSTIKLGGASIGSIYFSRNQL